MTGFRIFASHRALKRIIMAAALLLPLHSGAQVLFQNASLTISADSSAYQLLLSPGTSLTDVVITITSADGTLLFLENHHRISDFAQTIRRSDLGLPAKRIVISSRELRVVAPLE
jgi:hypothetical protein